MGLVWKIISNDVERKILQKGCLGSSSSSELVDVFGGKQGVLLGSVACGQLCVCRVHSGGGTDAAELSRTLRGGLRGSKQITEEEMSRNHQNA